MLAAQKARPVGEKATLETRIEGCVRRVEASPRVAPGRVLSRRSEKSEASPRVSRREVGPAAVRVRVDRYSCVPERERLLLMVYFVRRVAVATE